MPDFSDSPSPEADISTSRRIPAEPDTASTPNTEPGEKRWFTQFPEFGTNAFRRIRKR